MLKYYRFFLFVPPILLLCFPAFSQFQGKIELLPGSNTYQVSVIPLVNWEPPQSVTSSAQITLRALHGTLIIQDFQTLTGSWSQQVSILSPAEAPDFDYYSFSLDLPITTLDYLYGAPVPLFSFKNTKGCAHIEIVDNQSDPLMPPNSINVNIGNSFAVLGAGIGQNAYASNSEQNSADCPPVSIAPVADQNPVPCHNDLTNISLTAVSGQEPYQISWENLSTGDIGSAQILEYEGQTTMLDMNPGTYVFTTTDAFGSLGNDTLVIGNPPPIQIELSSFDASCNGSLDGSVYVSHVTGGTTSTHGFQYYWETNPDVSNSSADFLNPGIYSVTVADDNACTTSSSIEVSTSLIIYLNPLVGEISCHGASDGIIDLYPVGTNSPFTFEWSSNVNTGDYSSAWKLGPGHYTVTVTDATGVCTQTSDFFLDEPPAMEMEYALDQPRCYGDQAYLSNLKVKNALGDWTADFDGAWELGDFKYEIEPGRKAILTIQDSVGCEISEEFLIKVPKELFLELGDDIRIKYGQEAELNASYYPYENVFFEWNPSSSLDCLDCPDPIASPIKEETFRLVMTDAAGCAVEDKVKVRVYKSREIFIPNAFSPNHDDINDYFRPYGGFEVITIKDMKIFDRWGGMVYESDHSFEPNDQREGWDGTIRDKLGDAGSYLYIINVEFIDGETVLFKGDVNLIR